jgi:hypothetical protein
VRRLGFIALAAVITQGILGGNHGAVVPSRSDLDSRTRALGADRVLPHHDDCAGDLARLAPGLRAHDRGNAGNMAQGGTGKRRDSCSASPSSRSGLVYLQILVGATMRHTEAGLAIPDFPWAFGHVIPPHWTPKDRIHFAHRVRGALLVATMTLATAGHVFYHHSRRRALVRPALTLVGLGLRAGDAGGADGAQPEALHHSTRSIVVPAGS